MVTIYELKREANELAKDYDEDTLLIHESEWEDFVKSEFDEDIEGNIPLEFQQFIDYEEYEKYFIENRGYIKIEIGSEDYYLREG